MKQPNPIDVHVGSRMCLRRKMLGLSQEKLSEGLGISFQQVQKYEKGTNRVGASRLQDIARLLTVPVSSFFKDAPGAETVGAGDGATRLVTEFLSTSEGIALNRAFTQIRDAKLRRKVVELIRELGDDEEADQEIA